MADIGDVHAQPVAAACEFLDGDGIVEILGAFRVDGEEDLSVSYEVWFDNFE
jgi:hypothetical protein